MGKTNKEFNQFIHENEAFLSEIRSLANEVAQFAQNFELPGNKKKKKSLIFCLIIITCQSSMLPKHSLNCLIYCQAALVSNFAFYDGYWVYWLFFAFYYGYGISLVQCIM